MFDKNMKFAILHQMLSTATRSTEYNDDSIKICNIM